MQTIGSLRNCARFHVDTYTDPVQLYAFATYDSWWQRTPDRITPADVFMANCLSLRLGAPEVAPLFGPAGTPATRLLRRMQDVLGEAPSDDGVRFEDLTSIDDEPLQLFRTACAATDAR